MLKDMKLPQKKKTELAGLLREYIEGVVELQVEINRRLKAGMSGKIFEGLDISLSSAFGRKKDPNQRPVTKESIDILRQVVHLILKTTQLNARVSFHHVFDVLREELAEEFLLSENKRKSYHRIIDNTFERLGEKLKGNTVYVFPVILTNLPKPFTMEFGPLTFGDIDSFMDGTLAQEHISNPDDIDTEHAKSFENMYLESWEEIKSRAKHIITVQTLGYEVDLGKIVAERCAEFFLNWIRLSLRWNGDFKIKVLDQNQSQSHTPFFAILEGENAVRSLSSGNSEYVFLKDEEGLMKSLKDNHHLLFVTMDGIVRNSASRSVALQKIEYASFLISTAFRQKSVRIALVNFVSALETLACLTDEEPKRVALRTRCSKVLLGISDDERDKIYRVIDRAYIARNNVVHGDAFYEDDYWRIFRELDKVMLSLFVGFVDLLTHLEFTKVPKSSKLLRRAMMEHFST